MSETARLNAGRCQHERKVDCDGGAYAVRYHHGRRSAWSATTAYRKPSLYSRWHLDDALL